MSISRTFTAFSAAAALTLGIAKAGEPTVLFPYTPPASVKAQTVDNYIEQASLYPTETIVSANQGASLLHKIDVGCVSSGFLPLARTPIVPLPCQNLELFVRTDGIISKTPPRAGNQLEDI